ncbi:MAG: GPR endopeptidase [Ruminococcaceae bacterium]|nr:GPR endopeptidase [Oscillospiraceae bacterium]
MFLFLGILLLKKTVLRVIFLQNRTDLALESFEAEGKTALDGVIVREENGVTTVDVVNENGAAAIGKPVGRYITLEVNSFVNDTDIFDGRLEDFSAILRPLLPEESGSILIAGLGNTNITADALGPKTGEYILSTRHIINDLKRTFDAENIASVACVATGVLGDTGIETAEIIRGVASQIEPSCVIVVDALAASSAERLGTTVQFSDSGISPGSGVGNHRHEISRSTLGVPVISVGIPTVVSVAAINRAIGSGAYVTPREIDRIIQQGAKLIGMGINVALQPHLSARDIYALVG